MRTILLRGLFATLLMAGSAQGQIFDFNSGNSVGPIPDGNPVGVLFTGTISSLDPSATVSSLTISLNITGGFNGNLYSYLVSPSGTTVTLLDEPGAAQGANSGFGYGGAGFNLTLSDAGLTSIQTAFEANGVQFGGGGTYQADGSLSGFSGSSVDGTWSLYFADLVSGGGTSQLHDWSLNITSAPEPGIGELLSFGLMGICGLQLWRKRIALGASVY